VRRPTFPELSARIGRRIPGRGVLWAAIALVFAAWLGVAFAGALAETAATRARLAQEQAVNDALRARIAAGEREIALLDDRGFLDQLVRGWGLGAGRERGFRLADGAPSPAPLPALPGAPEAAPDPGFLGDLLRVVAGA